jgi:hypothetical protein
VDNRVHRQKQVKMLLHALDSMAPWDRRAEPFKAIIDDDAAGLYGGDSVFEGVRMNCSTTVS